MSSPETATPAEGTESCRQKRQKQPEIDRLRRGMATLEKRLAALERSARPWLRMVKQEGLAVPFIVDFVGDITAAMVAETRKEIREEFKDHAGLRYLGVYEARKQYSPGDVCTRSGSMWHCREPTREPPPGNSWQLCVKAGRDGRDASFKGNPP